MFPSMPVVVLTMLALLSWAVPGHAQFRIAAYENCNVRGASHVHFDLTLLQADYKVMVTDYQIVPDLTIRPVAFPHQADFILADGLQSSDVSVCRSPTRSGATTLFVAKFVPQPDITIAVTSLSWHYDYTMYVASKHYSVDEAAALFALFLRNAVEVR